MYYLMAASFLKWIMFMYVGRSKTESGDGMSASFHSGATKTFCELVVLNMVRSPLILHSLLAIVPSLFTTKLFWSIYLHLFSFSLPILLSCFSLVPINTNLLKLLVQVNNNQIRWHISLFFCPQSFLSWTSL